MEIMRNEFKGVIMKTKRITALILSLILIMSFTISNSRKAEASVLVAALGMALAAMTLSVGVSMVASTMTSGATLDWGMTGEAISAEFEKESI